MRYRFCLLLLGCLLAGSASAQQSDDRLYGTITTRDGAVFEGLIRWDMNEASWVDILDGDKMISAREDRRRRTSIRVFGIEVAEFEDSDDVRSRTSGIRMGHLESMENIGSNRALLTIRSGQRIEFRGGSTDIGNDIRSIVIEDPARGEVELRWRDVDRIDFAQAPSTARSRYGERLYGTLTTRRGLDFTGYICWDVDEVLGDDVLDGDDEDGYDRKIRFDNLTAIERNSSSSARVELRNGDAVLLRGSNDVNSQNRDILVLDPALGQVRVPWEEFGRVEFFRPDYPVTYSSFYGGGPLQGTVHTADGEQFVGLIRWDNDEAHAWELLNGELGDLEFDIEMGLVAEIERLSSRSALVVLRDGRELELDGSNDVNEDNDGIFVALSNGDEVRIRWRDFERVVFDKP